MFEAARHGGGGHWERVGRGGDWRGWQMVEDRGELGKTCSSTVAVTFCCCLPPVCSCWNPAVGHRAGMPSGSFKHSSPPFTPNRWFPWGSEAGLPLQAPP